MGVRSRGMRGEGRVVPVLAFQEVKAAKAKGRYFWPPRALSRVGCWAQRSGFPSSPLHPYQSFLPSSELVERERVLCRRSDIPLTP